MTKPSTPTATTQADAAHAASGGSAEQSEKSLFARGLGRELTSIDLLKALAITTMIIDHVGYYFIVDDSWWRLVGRFSAPIWLFLIGFAVTRDIPKRLVWGAIFLIFVDAATMEPLLPFNILASIIFVRWALPIITKPSYLKPENLLPITVLLACLALPSWFSVEYGVLCILLGMLGHLCRHDPTNKAGIAMTAVACWAVYTFWQPLVFDFDTTQQILLGIGTAVMLFGLTRFQKARFADTGQAWYAPVLRLFGRYSLEIYILHITAFCIIAYWLADYDQFAIILAIPPDTTQMLPPQP